ncbi:hypothetical protein [Rhodococcus opacus]|uniref:hypothetical protein n=1 Tax=Rhodococcus opacus TaxID=37919 RepID=UPI001F5416B1|nr:hypothetical protein [Rhodococcus opacus]
MRTPRSGGAVLFFLRTRTDLPPVLLTDAERRSAISGTPAHGYGPITTSAPPLRTALLALWGL